MLTIFIVPSNEGNANADKTIASFSGIDLEYRIVHINEYRDINNYEDKSEWFGVFWDNECIDTNLKEALPIYFLYNSMEALVLYKKVSMVDAVWRYRIFRSSVYLGPDFSPVTLWLCKEIVLDGWVLEHEYPN